MKPWMPPPIVTPGAQPETARMMRAAMRRVHEIASAIARRRKSEWGYGTHLQSN
jgi:hypothetical protein